MYTIYALAAIGTAIGIFIFSRGTKKTIGEFLFHSGCGALSGGFIGFMSSMLLTIAVPTVLFTKEPVTLVSMRNQDGLTGSFIFGSGSVQSTMNYNFLMKQTDESMVPGSIPASEVVHFIEDPSLKNTGFWQTTISRPDPSHWLYAWSILHSDRIRTVRQEFRVPVGSVIQQFNIR